MKLPLIKHICAFVEANDEDFVEEAIEVLEHLTDYDGLAEGDVDVLGEMLSNLYGALEVEKTVREDGVDRKEALNAFMKRAGFHRSINPAKLTLELLGQFGQFLGVHISHVGYSAAATQGAHHLLHFSAFHLLHHLLHLAELLDQLVGAPNLNACSFGNSFLREPALSGQSPLFFGHRKNNRLMPPAAFLLVSDFACSCRVASLQPNPWIPFFSSAHLGKKILEVEFGLEHLFSHPHGFLLVEVFLGLFYQGYDIAHSQDSRGQAIGMKNLELIDLFANAKEFDRAPVTFFIESCSSASVSIDLGQHDL